MSIIDQLKKNEKPFGLMSEEMQKVAREIGLTEFLILSIIGIAINWPKWNRLCGGNFFYKETYRLRPGYQDEPEIVECEIILDPESNIWGYKCPCSSDPVNADSATSCPGFRLIGFKFEDVIWYGSPIMPVDNSGNQISWANITIDDIASGKVKILDATHVLFRRQK